MFEVKTKKLGSRLDERIVDTKPLLKSMKFIVVTEKGIFIRWIPYRIPLNGFVPSSARK